VRGLAGASAALAAIAPALAIAEPLVAADTRTSLYADDDATTIHTTIAAVKGYPTDRVSVSGHYLADIISSASVDVVSAATGGWEETRHEGAGGLSYRDGTHTLAAGYVYSVEHDWRSHSASLGGSRDFWQHRLTLGAGGSYTTNDVGRAADAGFHEDLDQVSLSLDAALVASKLDLLALSYTMVYVTGYQASPYRFVYFRDPSVAGQLASGPEVAPEARVRHALGLKWNRHLFRDTALRTHVRGYADDWGVLSLTGGTEYVVGFWKLEAGAFVRGYVQKGADFYQDVYDARYRYMTSDRELSDFVDAFGGARLAFHSGAVSAFDDLRAELKGTVFTFDFFDFARLPSRQGYIAEAAVGASF
jgi:hypothetical protein